MAWYNNGVWGGDAGVESEGMGRPSPRARAGAGDKADTRGLTSQPASP